MRRLRALPVLAVLVAPSACAPDTYSKVPYPSGPWTPANVDPASQDNNLLPEFARGDLS